MFRLDNKIAVITGGGSGIGKAIAACFAGQGATSCIVELNQSAADHAVSEIRKNNVKAFSYSCNVADQQQVKTTIEAILKQHSRIDLLVNSAGISHIGKLENTTEQDFEKIFQVNVKGVYNVMHAVISQMKNQKHGVILNLASIASSIGLADRFAYSMSKGAVMSMTLVFPRHVSILLLLIIF
jgi:2-keto-3-deoxy-L-fuconate dehydrogenase